MGAVATGSDGTTHALWGTEQGFRSRRAPEGRPWGPKATLSREGPFGYILQTQAVGVDAIGNVTAAWVLDRGYPFTASEITTAHQAPGGDWSRPVVLARRHYEDFPVAFLDLAVGASGHVAVTWNDPESSTSWARYRAPRGRWSRPVRLPGCCGRVAMDAGGRATFASYDYVSRGLLLTQRTPRRWRAPVVVAARQGSPAFDIDAAGPGEVVVAWETPKKALRAARFTGTWAESALLKKPGRPGVTDLDLAVEASVDGSAAFVWSTGDGDLHAAYQDAGSVAAPTKITHARILYVLLATDSSGVNVAWTTNGRGVYLSRHNRGTAADQWTEPAEVTNLGARKFSLLAMSASPHSPTTTLLWEGNRGAVNATRLTATP